MIFKSFLTPKYKNKDPKVRLSAIAGLSPQDPEDKTHLHELAFNDANTQVRLAALHRLNQFVLWWKMAETDSNAQIKKQAYQIVEQQLLATEPDLLTTKERNQFIKECTNNALLEKVARQSDNASLVLEILTRLNRPQLNKQIFFATDNADVQLALLDQFDDIASLLKVLKKASSAHVRELAEQKLQQQEQQQQRRQVVDRQTRLVLAKLAALVDSPEYQVLLEGQTQLNSEFETLQQQFDLLEKAQADEYLGKHQQIQQSLKNRLVRLYPEWHKEQQQQAALQADADKLAIITDVIGEVDSALNTDLEQISQVQSQQWSQQLSDFRPQLMQMGSQAAQQYLKRIEQLQQQLADLEQIKQARQQATQYLQTLKDLVLPENIEQWLAIKAEFDKVKQQWRQLQHNIPRSWLGEVSHQWHDVVAQWNKTIRGLETDINQQLDDARQQLFKFDRLIQAGKFHGAMALHRKLSAAVQQLPETYRQKIQSKLDNATQEVEKLQDWQAYIAAPRKPELLQQVQALAEQPKPVKEQAELVKQLRQDWNSLGKLNTEEDDAQNQAFEKWSEQAFQPCREYYQQQEKIRSDNLAHKQQIIAELQQLTDAEMDDAEKVKQFNRLEQRWYKTGEVDHKLRQPTGKQYQQAKEPLKAIAASFYQENERRKLLLIKQAEQLDDVEDIQQAIEQAKQLQQKWKAIGSAGNKQDDKLWQQFRTLNNKVFDKRDEQQAQQKASEKQQITELEKWQSDWSGLIQQSQDISELQQQGLQFQQDMQNKVAELSPSATKSWQGKMDKLQQAQQQRIEQLQQHAELNRFEDLFALLADWQQGELPAEVELLPNAWQQALRVNHADADKRRSLTLQMEILQDKDSPAEDETLRKEIQLQLMADKLQTGTQPDLDELLTQWLQCGAVSQQQQPLLQRLKAVYLASPNR
ncbi:DUF349 domain-containing protein [Neptunicella sp. SCSIO 80796]|uniref:DUF349 domain-containing protein n=1 Tax=Neptunicella plasticusilytica TaxID=3117012 RepID=UPI003A4E4B5E